MFSVYLCIHSHILSTLNIELKRQKGLIRVYDKKAIKRVPRMGVSVNRSKTKYRYVLETTEMTFTYKKTK